VRLPVTHVRTYTPDARVPDVRVLAMNVTRRHTRYTDVRILPTYVFHDVRIFRYVRNFLAYVFC